MPREKSLLKALEAKTMLGRANYLIDAFLETKPVQDEVAHAIVEIFFGKGTLEKRLLRYGKKLLRYKVLR